MVTASVPGPTFLQDRLHSLGMGLVIYMFPSIKLACRSCLYLAGLQYLLNDGTNEIKGEMLI